MSNSQNVSAVSIRELLISDIPHVDDRRDETAGLFQERHT